jgi:hypothetical protein
MASNSQIMNINNFVSEFLETHQGSETLLEDWNSDEVQSALSAVVVKAMKKVSRKSKKDKNKPKRGSSAYIIFCGEERGNVIIDNPEMTAKEIVKELGARWTKLKLDNEDEITRLNGLSEIDKERYRTEMETYEPPVDDSGDDEPKKKKKKKQTGPKRGKSAYLFFCEKERKSIKDDEPDLPPKEVTIKLGHAWQELKDEDRADEMSVFTDLAAKDKARYAEEKENWENSDVEDDHKPKKVPKAKKEATKKAASKKKAAPKKKAAAEEVEDDEDDEIVEEKAAAKKVAAKKAAAKKAAAKKAAAKKAAAKKAAAKKAAAEEVEDGEDEDGEDDELVEDKAAEKKAAAKKEASKKAAAKKAAAKKSAAQEDDDELVEETNPKKKKTSVKKSSGKKMTGYVMFSKDFRKKAADETPELKGAGVTKALALAWRALGNDGKEEWKAKAKDL